MSNVIVGNQRFHRRPTLGLDHPPWTKSSCHSTRQSTTSVVALSSGYNNPKNQGTTMWHGGLLLQSSTFQQPQSSDSLLTTTLKTNVPRRVATKIFPATSELWLTSYNNPENQGTPICQDGLLLKSFQQPQNSDWLLTTTLKTKARQCAKVGCYQNLSPELWLTAAMLRSSCLAVKELPEKNNLTFNRFCPG